MLLACRSRNVRFGKARLDVRNGSWLCENANTLNRNRRSYSSKAALVAERASGLNLEVELENIIPLRVSIFEFLHSQGQKAKYSLRAHRVGSAPENGLKSDIAGGPFLPGTDVRSRRRIRI